jgi:peptidoglycan/xylan/chitin deacetylase (PgdA/CDA1 family)
VCGLRSPAECPNKSNQKHNDRCMNNLLLRIKGKYHRTLANQFCRRMVTVTPSIPLISFTFDDAPKTAFKTGGAILDSCGAKATYYLSLALLGTETEVGEIAGKDDLLAAVDNGHELGCHTFNHLDAWYTSTDKYMTSVMENQQALEKILPGQHFSTFAYPKSGATLPVKYPLQKLFTCCRGGGQVANVGMTDLNMLKACFLDKRTNIDLNFIKKLIDYNANHKGWLIFATHDVADNPSPYGCTTEFFREVVDYSARSGAALLTVKDACKRLSASAIQENVHNENSAG